MRKVTQERRRSERGSGVSGFRKSMETKDNIGLYQFYRVPGGKAASELKKKRKGGT